MSEDKDVREQQPQQPADEVEDLEAKEESDDVVGGWARYNAGRGPDWRQS